MAPAKPSDSSRNEAGHDLLSNNEGAGFEIRAERIGGAQTKPRRRPKRGRGEPPHLERPSGRSDTALLNPEARSERHGSAPPSKPSARSETHANEPASRANRHGGAPPAPEVLAQALPFATIPDEPLRAHFTRWLARSLTGPSEPAEKPGESQVQPDVKPQTQKRAEPPQTPPRATSAPADPSAPATPEAPGSGGVQSRPQFVRSRDGTVWVTRPILRSRGWTDAAIRDYLPEPEGLKPNPRFAATGAPMPVWRPVTVAAAEATSEWRAWLERSLRRRRTTLEALEETEDEDFRARLETARAAINAEGGPPPALLVQ